MSFPTTVVVNAAGLGTRLGLDRPKSLVEIHGQPLIVWQLRALRDVPDVRVVVGYRAHQLIDVVFAERPDATVVLNHAFATTRTAASLMLGAAGCDGLVLSLDGDLLVHPADLAAFLTATCPQIGVGPIRSVEPVGVTVDASGSAFGFQRHALAAESLEWTGLVCFDPNDARLGPRDGHVFELIAPLLPMPAVTIRSRELDYPSELAEVSAFLAELLDEGAIT